MEIFEIFLLGIWPNLFPMYFSDRSGFVQRCVGECPSVVNYCDVTLRLMLGESFCYFLDIIYSTCILYIFLKPLNPVVFQAAVYIVL
jgi:hypothetical protein